MKDELDDLAGHWMKALMSIEENKKRVARWYDKKVKAKEFANGDLVWNLILPIGTKSLEFGLGYFKRKQKNPQAHRYRCSLHPGVF